MNTITDAMVEQLGLKLWHELPSFDSFLSKKDANIIARYCIKQTQALRDECERYKTCLEKIADGDHIGVGINKRSAILTMIEDALSPPTDQSNQPSETPTNKGISQSDIAEEMFSRNQSSESALKAALPCPFCGVEANVVDAPHGKRVYCNHKSGCIIQGNIVYDFQLTAWNHRPHMQQERDELECSQSKAKSWHTSYECACKERDEARREVERLTKGGEGLTRWGLEPDDDFICKRCGQSYEPQPEDNTCPTVLCHDCAQEFYALAVPQLTSQQEVLELVRAYLMALPSSLEKEHRQKRHEIITAIEKVFPKRD